MPALGSSVSIRIARIFVTLRQNPLRDVRGMVMAGNKSVAAYRCNAANCVEMAKEFSEPDKKLTLLDMANAWLRLAEITEKFGGTLIV